MMDKRRIKALYPQAIARWESKNGRYFVELRRDSVGYSYLARDAGGSLSASTEDAAIAKLESELQYYAPDGARGMERVV